MQTEKLFILKEYHYDWYEFEASLCASPDMEKLIAHAHSKEPELMVVNMSCEEGKEFHSNFADRERRHFAIEELEII